MPAPAPHWLQKYEPLPSLSSNLNRSRPPHSGQGPCLFDRKRVSIPKRGRISRHRCCARVIVSPVMPHLLSAEPSPKRMNGFDVSSPSQSPERIGAQRNWRKLASCGIQIRYPCPYRYPPPGPCETGRDVWLHNSSRRISGGAGLSLGLARKRSCLDVFHNLIPREEIPNSVGRNLVGVGETGRYTLQAPSRVVRERGGRNAHSSSRMKRCFRCFFWCRSNFRICLFAQLFGSVWDKLFLKQVAQRSRNSRAFFELKLCWIFCRFPAVDIPYGFNVYGGHGPALRLHACLVDKSHCRAAVFTHLWKSYFLIDDGKLFIQVPKVFADEQLVSGRLANFSGWKRPQPS